jgi:hypothetical protein
MGFIPSIKLSEALTNAGVGLWIEQLGDGRIALVCKAPETAVKALHRGAVSSFLISTIQAESLTILCLGLWINDERENPFKATMVNASPEDAALLTHILEAGVMTLHCLNELNHPVLSAWCSLEPEASSMAADALRTSNHRLITLDSSKLAKLPDLSRMLNLALDSFQRHIHRSGNDPISEDVKITATIPLKLDIWKPIEIFEVTPTSAGGPFLIDDKAEGLKLERLIHVVVDSIFPGNSYISPDVQDGRILRELTDILGLDSDFICVVQAKAMAVLTVDEQPSSRRTGNVEKDIKKGLKQLAGALTNIRAGSLVFPHKEKAPIAILNRDTALAHAIVVLSEMYAGVNWRAIAAKVAEASGSEVHRALFHVLDIQELANLAARCKNAETFSNRLIQRWFFVQEKGTAYVRAKFPVL